MGRALLFAVTVYAAAVASSLFHEAGHCAAYRLQGVPAGMSLMKEFPLRDVTAREFALGSLGGPLASAVLLAASLALHARARRAGLRLAASAFVMAGLLYFLVRALIALLKRRSGELGEVAGVLGVGDTAVVVSYLAIALAALVRWMVVARVRPRPRAVGAFVGLLLGYLVVLAGLEAFDQRTFWGRFPTVRVDDGRTYNEPP